MASMSGRSRSTTAAYSWLRIADMTHLMLMVIRARGMIHAIPY